MPPNDPNWTVEGELKVDPVPIDVVPVDPLPVVEVEVKPRTFLKMSVRRDKLDSLLVNPEAEVMLDVVDDFLATAPTNADRDGAPLSANERYVLGLILDAHRDCEWERFPDWLGCVTHGQPIMGNCRLEDEPPDVRNRYGCAIPGPTRPLH
jgi:hypothetical protein